MSATAKKPRRQYKTGGITKRKDGRFQGTIENGTNAKGGRRIVYVYGKTEAEVKLKLKERKRQIDADGPSTTDVSVRTTVKSWSAEWLTMTERTLRPKSWETDRGAVNKWIVPTIGQRRLTDLGPRDVRAVQKAQRDAGRSTSTLNRTQTTLTSMLRAALQEGHHVPRNCLEVPAPTRAVNDRTNMSVIEALAVLQVASYLPHGSRWAMTLLHGWRQAECLGLTWPAVNLTAGFIVAEWQLQPLPYIDNKNKALGFRIPDGYDIRHLEGQFHLTRPKTKKGFRAAPLIPAMQEALRHWREVCPDSPHDLVWPNLDGSPTVARKDREEWYALQGTAQVGHPSGRYYLVHEGRHTTAQELLELGVDEHDATSLMGHSSIRTTRGYQHPSQRTALSVLEKLGERFKIDVFALGNAEAADRP